MLILTRRIPERRPGETLYVGDDVQVTVLGIQGHQVRIGIQAPKEIPVHREGHYHECFDAPQHCAVLAVRDSDGL